MASVTLESVSKTYNSRQGMVHAVDDVDLEVRDEEFVVLVGPSGCGKSTTLRLIAGLERESSGVIRIDGRDVTGAAPKDRDIAMVFQNYALYPHMTVFQNMAFGLKMRRVPKKEIEKNISERNGEMLFIEKRMLDSIDTCVESSQLTEDEILQAKKLPNLRDMHQDLAFHDLFYTVTQRMGSHAVHGTWTDLFCHYLEKGESGKLTLRDHDVRPHENEFILVSLFIVDTLREFIMYRSNDPEMNEAFCALFMDIENEIRKISELVLGEDYDVVQASENS